MEPGALVVGEVLERLDLVQARVGVARVPQVLQVPPRRLLLAGGQRVDEGVEILAGGGAHAGILAIRRPDCHPWRRPPRLQD
jgi:hypothetical protein